MRQNFSRALFAFVSASFVTSCSCSDGSQQYIDLTVEHPAGLSSICVKVTATSEALSKETAPMPVSGAQNLKVALYRDNLPSIVTLKAVGYSDTGCTTPSVPAEESMPLRAGFATSPAPFTLHMDKAMGVDVDRDGFNPPNDCDDSDPAIHPGVPERCADGVDNDCNGAKDCADTTCDLQNCGAGAVCMSSTCVETSCSDRVDGDHDGTVDCADSDCATKACSLSGTGATCVGITCVEQVSACNNGVDDDQDGDADCRDSDCLGATCGTGGTCVAAAADGGSPARCLEPTETLCADGADNDGDNQSDCADSDCATHLCNDGNACSTGETCMGTNCGGGTMTVCNMAPNACFSTNGACNPSNGQCLYAPVAAATMCVDSDPCTEPDLCDGDGGCAGSPRVCAPPPTSCFGNGVCQAALDGGCSYAVMTGMGCTDGNSCTVGDSCAADGGCTPGALQTCTPAECKTFTAGNCDTNGACQFGNANAGTTCDGGTCNASGACVAIDAGFDAGVDAGFDAGFDAGVDAGSDAGSFPYAVDNVVLANHPPQGAFVVDCALTLNSTTGFGTPCAGGTVPSLVVADGGAAGELAVFSVSSLVVTDAGSISMSGGRPVVFLVWGDATVSGQLLANSTRASGGRVGPGASNVGSTCVGRLGGAGQPASNARGGGGGGAAYFSNGGLGGGGNTEAGSRGDAGVLAMGGDVPLFIGCPGGVGSADNAGGNTLAGVGGGALQISVAGTATFNAIVTTSGQGGRGGAGGSEPGGGGGGSGGALLIQANRLVATANARLISNGGAGGGGAQGGTATNGGDGTTNSATVSTGGANDGSGGNGGAGGAGATNPANGTTASRGGGGGGGSAGRIFLKHYDSGTACNMGSATLSPAAQRTNCP